MHFIKGKNATGTNALCVDSFDKFVEPHKDMPDVETPFSIPDTEEDNMQNLLFDLNYEDEDEDELIKTPLQATKKMDAIKQIEGSASKRTLMFDEKTPIKKALINSVDSPSLAKMTKAMEFAEMRKNKAKAENKARKQRTQNRQSQAEELKTSLLNGTEDVKTSLGTLISIIAQGRQQKRSQSIVSSAIKLVNSLKKANPPYTKAMQVTLMLMKPGNQFLADGIVGYEDNLEDLPILLDSMLEMHS